MRLDEIVLWERSYPFYLRGFFVTVFLACEREYLSLSADERKTYDWSIQCHKFRTSTCSRELPTLWDFLLTRPLPLPLPVLVAEPEPVPVADDDEDEWLDVFSRKKEEEVQEYTVSFLSERKTRSQPNSIKKGKNLLSLPSQVLLHETSGSYVDLQLGCRCFDYHAPPISGGGLLVDGADLTRGKSLYHVVEVYQRPKGWVQRPFPQATGGSQYHNRGRESADTGASPFIITLNNPQSRRPL
ncbi:hypothetical protein PAPYR_12050 [Paratrimastix pyriformis]|uniref:Uncharacterized protein n=1 Tax=Paratrimastix pyriformis TaxID=342808 RepID=A0ABQ8U801_9EUKA|nr:hypothetical protein PAPYR_12050 [Paratrimastix pyriformis]